MKFRYYQNEAISSVWNYFTDGNTGNPLIVMPTGTGKSVVIAGFIQSVFRHYANQRIMMLTHVKELIEQNFEKLEIIWDTAPAGIYSASVGRKEHTFPITFAGIGSVVNKAHLFKHIDLLVIDEAHLVSHKSTTMYRRFINELLKYNPHLKVIGLTATHYRLGQGLLTEEGGLFTDVCYDLSKMENFNRLIDEGYLCRLIPKNTKQKIDLEGVRMRGGEYIEKDIQEACDQEEITRGALQECMELGSDRHKWLIFASGVEHAQHISEMLDMMEISNVCIHGKLKKIEREKLLHEYKTGDVKCAVNNNILTTGFDLNTIDLIAVLRPTQSPNLWVQMLGRGTRPVYEEGFDLETVEGRIEAIKNSQKPNCLVLDFAGNTRRLGPINDPVIPKKAGKGGGLAPVRICPQCNSMLHTSVRVCNVEIERNGIIEECGYEFPKSVNFAQFAGTDELITSGLPVIEVFKVDQVFYSKHQGKDLSKPPVLRVQYLCGLQTFSETVCFEHPVKSYPNKLARDWWREHGQSDNFIPRTIDDALNAVNTLPTPINIRVWVNKKYPEVTARDYTGSEFINTENESAE